MPESPAITRFIKPEILSRISNLQLLARGVVEGFLSGLHKSPYKGASVEFVSYRPYIHGDYLMHVDWKLFARTDRLFVKEFEEETNTRFDLMVDVSPSMGYTSGTVTKQDYAFFLASSLGYFMTRQQDAVGLTLFDDAIVTRIPARRASGHLLTILQHMHDAKPGKATAMSKPLHELAEAQRRRGFIVLISDLLDTPEAIVDGLRHFRFDGHNVLVFHVLDPQEVAFQFSEMVEFEDMETGEKMVLEAESARVAYQENFNRYRETLTKACGGLGIDYNLVTTDQPLDFALFQYLAARSRYR